MSIESIKKREQAATPGPWGLWHGDDTYAMNCYGVTVGHCDHDYVDEDNHPQHTVALTLLQQPRYASLSGEYRGDWDDNAAFIAHARQDMPALLKVAEAAAPVRAFVEQLREHGRSDIVIDLEAIAAALADLDTTT